MPNENENDVLTEETETVDATLDSESVELETAPISDELELIRARERADREYDEFTQLFPEMSLSELPDSVVEGVQSGLTLCAACALYERRRDRALVEAERANDENRERSFVLHSDGGNDPYFSQDEVREMSPGEVHKNYKKIIESMNHWN